MVAVYTSLCYLAEKQVDRIVITRPTVSKEELGFLPGNIEDKMDPWMAPIHENMKFILGKEVFETLLGDGKVDIKPLSYMRGQTFTKSAIIVDEAQNVTNTQMEMILGRLGKRSKMMVCGDMRQKDLQRRTKSGFPMLIRMSQQIPEVGDIELKQNHRHPLVDKILNFYKDMDEQQHE